LGKSELVYALVAVEKQRQQQEPDAYWPDYYARFFIENYLQ